MTCVKISTTRASIVVVNGHTGRLPYATAHVCSISEGVKEGGVRDEWDESGQ